MLLFQSPCAQCYDSVFKSMLLHQSHTTIHYHRRGSSPQKEKPKKQFIRYYMYHTMKTVFIVFPLEMSLVAEQRVMMAGFVRELAHRHKAMPSAQKRKAQRHQQRGF